jgi:hypothetical protein
LRATGKACIHTHALLLNTLDEVILGIEVLTPHKMTRLGEFSQMGDCFLWAVFFIILKWQKYPVCLCYFTPR